MNYISIRNVGKKYKIYHSKINKLLSWFFPKNECYYTPKVILEDISFSVERGESVGIIGMNGAGKSTLLKLITGTSRPTSGSIDINGSVSALLELGMGFHPEFTGRENAFMAGQLLGLNNKEIEEAIPFILDFSEISEALDIPVKNYSSGMHVRLAFAIATYKRPDILIIDEALAVGDAYFQHKCFDRIRFFKEQGTTLLFVSHDPVAVKNLCDRAILLNKGKVILDAEPDDVLDYYNSLLSISNNKEQLPNLTTSRGVRCGTKELEIVDVQTYSEKGESRIFHSGKMFGLNIKIVANSSVNEFAVGISFRDKMGNIIFGTNTAMLRESISSIRKGEERYIKFEIPSLGIGPGSFSISIALHDKSSHVNGNYDWWDKAVMFEVVSGTDAPCDGICYFPIQVYIE